jgi:hypothetical protein
MPLKRLQPACQAVTFGDRNLKYVNRRNKFEVDLRGLTEEEKKFYSQALTKFRQGVPWVSFEQFAFDPRSPIYKRRRSHLEVLKAPLYLALEDMWLQLGVQQGLIAEGKTSARSSGDRRPSVAKGGRRVRGIQAQPATRGVRRTS